MKKFVSMFVLAVLLVGMFPLFIGINSAAQDYALPIVWEAVYDEGKSEVFYNVAVDGDGNLIAVGTVINYLTDEQAGLIAKYNKDGDLLWSASLNPYRWTGFWDVDIDSHGNIVVLGRTTSNRGAQDYGGDQIAAWIIAKYYPNGTLMWQKYYRKEGMGYHASGGSGLVIYNDEIICTGVAGYQFRVIKLDSNGNLLWEIRPSIGAQGQGITIDKNGDIIVSGQTSLYPSSDVCLIKLSQSGEELWSKRFDWGGNEVGKEVAVDADNNIIVVGGSPPFIVKFNSDGEQIWKRDYIRADIHSADYLEVWPNRYSMSAFGEAGVSPYYVEYDYDGNLVFEAIFHGGSISKDKNGRLVGASCIGTWPDVNATLTLYNYPWTGIIHIRADGSVDPPDAPIFTSDNIIYSLKVDICGGIVIERDNIILDGSGFTIYTDVLGVEISQRCNITIKNFNIVNGYEPEAGQFPEWQFGIYVHKSSHIKIIGNNITKNLFSIWLEDSHHNEIIGNNIYKNYEALRLNYSSYNIIRCNNISFNEWGIILDWHNTNNVITENTVAINAQTGIQLVYSSNNIIAGNNVTGNEDGIWLAHLSRNNRINNNSIVNNWYGVTFENASSTNTIYHNNFIENEQQVYDLHWSSPWVPSSNNIWNNSYPFGGNYWSNYTGVDYYRGPNQNEPGSDGIGDTPHIIDENNVDYYPLMGSFNSLRVLAEYALDIVSNSTMEAFQYDEQSRTLILHVSNKTSEQTHGFCRITIPHTLIPPPYNVTVNNVPIQYSTIFENETISIIHFTYKHSTIEIKITQQPLPPPTYTLTISTSTGGTTDPAPGTYTYPEGTEVSITAIPSIGFSFNHWLLNGSFRVNNPITIVMNADYTLVAYFIDDIPPQISQPIQQPPPDEVQPGQEVHVWVNVTDLGTGIKNVTLWYSIDNGTTWTIVNMTAYREIYEALWGATIPGFDNCTWVTYKIVAYDNAENMAVENNNDYNYQYHVIPEYPSTVQTLVILILAALTAIIWKTKRNVNPPNFLYKPQQFH